jgi:hypothetical protein
VKNSFDIPDDAGRTTARMGDESKAAAVTPSAVLLFLRHQKWFTCHRTTKRGQKWTPCHFQRSLAGSRMHSRSLPCLVPSSLLS